MKQMIIIISFYIFSWITFTIGFIFIKIKTNISIKYEILVWNKRIDRFQNKPFSSIIKMYENNNYFGIVILVVLLNITMVLLQSLAGFILISPLLTAIIGFNAGVLIAQADKKTMIFSIFVLVFELGAFSTSAGIGFYIGLEWIFNKIPYFKVLFKTCNEGYYFIPLICLIINGMFEASGIFFKIEGVPGIKAYKEKMYK